MLLVVLLISISNITGGYILIRGGKEAILQEKRNGLSGISHLLKDHLTQLGGFTAMQGKIADKETRSRRVTEKLAGYAESVAQAFPGVGVGYYLRELDASVSYGTPYNNGTVGNTISAITSHGHGVMATGQAEVFSVIQAYGTIMAAIVPVFEKGAVVGYVWAIETIDSVDRQLVLMRTMLLLLSFLSLLLSVTFMYCVSARLTRDVLAIKNGLAGFEHDLHLHIPPMNGETGDIAKAINSMADSLFESVRNERKQAAEALWQQEETLRTAIATIDEAFVLYDPDDRLTYCNEKYLEAFPKMAGIMVPGNTYEYIVRTSYARGVSPQSSESSSDWIDEQVKNHREGKVNFELRTDDGRWYQFIDRKTVTGHIVGFRIDITKLKRATETAEAANRAKSEFLANMSHEIRTPLHGMFGMTQLLEATPLTNEQQGYVMSLKQSGNNLLSLINDILDLSKIEADKLAIEVSELSLSQCISETVAIVRQAALEKRLKLEVDIATDIPAVLKGDKLRLKQIFINLLSNAIKFTAEGSVVISAQLLEQNIESVLVQVVVRDTGIGVSAGVIEEIFKPFVQEDGTTTRRFGGTGLGLAISRRLTEMMGGSLSVESSPGFGSTFRAHLPFIIGRSSRVLEQIPQKALFLWDGPPLRVLLVEDDQTSSNFGISLLHKLGHTVVSVDNGRKCLNELVHDSFDLVLMDIKMPEMDGEEALSEIRKNERKTSHYHRIIAVTAHSLRGDRERFLRLGFDGYLSKPLETKEIISEMKRVLGIAVN